MRTNYSPPSLDCANAPYSLRELDIELMKRLAPRVNVIPVIGRADSLTPAELAESKKLVMEDIEHYRIPVYNFPYDIEEDDEDTVEENAELRGLMPFAIVGSEETVEIGGRTVRARQYPWGVVEVDNPRHSDFLAIRSALLHSHLADLKEITHDFLYENYRTEKLSKSVEGGAGVYVYLQSVMMNQRPQANVSQRFVYEPRGPGLPVRASQGGAAPPRGGEAARDRDQGPARDQREAPGAPCPRVSAQGDRGSHATRTGGSANTYSGGEWRRGCLSSAHCSYFARAANLYSGYVEREQAMVMANFESCYGGGTERGAWSWFGSWSFTLTQYGRACLPHNDIPPCPGAQAGKGKQARAKEKGARSHFSFPITSVFH